MFHRYLGLRRAKLRIREALQAFGQDQVQGPEGLLHGARRRGAVSSG